MMDEQILISKKQHCFCTNGEMTKLYGKFNKKYFKSRLPKDMVVRFEDTRPLGFTHICFNRAAYIILNKRLRWSIMLAAPTLLHEMIHVEHPDWGHGQRFHKRMLQLAKDGALKLYW